jgi:hypothetical protein
MSAAMSASITGPPISPHRRRRLLSSPCKTRSCSKPSRRRNCSCSATAPAMRSAAALSSATIRSGRIWFLASKRTTRTPRSTPPPRPPLIPDRPRVRSIINGERQQPVAVQGRGKPQSYRLRRSARPGRLCCRKPPALRIRRHGSGDGKVQHFNARGFAMQQCGGMHRLSAHPHLGAKQCPPVGLFGRRRARLAADAEFLPARRIRFRPVRADLEHTAQPRQRPRRRRLQVLIQALWPAAERPGLRGSANKKTAAAASSALDCTPLLP